MKKNFACLCTFCFLSFCLHAQDSTINYLQTQDTIKKKPITISGNIQLTNDGIAPVPIFALGKPAIISSAVIRRKRFYYNNELFYGINAKPWTINNRFGYFIVNNKKLDINVATNFSLYFLHRNPNLNNNEEFQLQQYWANEINGEYRFSANRKLQFLFWHTQDLDKLGVQREEFFNVAFSIENIKLFKTFLLGIRPDAFYLFDKGVLHGVFVSQTSFFQKANWKFNFFLQTALPVYVVPGNRFIWNTGINIPF